MDIAYEFQKVRILFTDDGLVAVLEKMPTASVPLVKGYGIPGHKPAHDFAERGSSGAQQGMKMVWNERPGVALGPGLIQYIRKAVEEGYAVLIVLEDFLSFNSPGHHML